MHRSKGSLVLNFHIIFLKVSLKELISFESMINVESFLIYKCIELYGAHTQN